LQAELIAHGKDGSKYMRRPLARRNDQSQDR
jgi:hypothetical protein